ncbi:hypothetical protein AVEN_270520-1 [Araneus ventricosus]|uniref:Uncharacterized protein n=1 Tax=Araneus ventricosus TaxID=182803 RepID=A0A4Y2B5G9_ARAVE|nr:hypothetical protein AVEN_270520-1 [Araneus ventricosus]
MMRPSPISATMFVNQFFGQQWCGLDSLNKDPMTIAPKCKLAVPDSNFSLQQACNKTRVQAWNKFDMTRMQAWNKFDMTKAQDCNKLTQASKSPWDELATSLPRQTHCKL